MITQNYDLQKFSKIIESEDLSIEDIEHIQQSLTKRSKNKKEVKMCVVSQCKNKSTNHYDLCRKHCGKHKYDREDCAICMENFPQQPLSCGHWIHFDCIIKTEKKECPMCKSVLSFTRDQLKKFNQYQREIQIKRDQEEEQERIQRRRARREQQLLNNDDYFIPRDLIRFINIISNGENRRINRQQFIQFLLEI
jgi:hypothetical protein